MHTPSEKQLHCTRSRSADNLPMRPRQPMPGREPIHIGQADSTGVSDRLMCSGHKGRLKCCVTSCQNWLRIRLPQNFGHSSGIRVHMYKYWTALTAARHACTSFLLDSCTERTKTDDATLNLRSVQNTPLRRQLEGFPFPNLPNILDSNFSINLEMRHAQ